MILQDFFSVNTAMFTFWDYQMSYLEFIGTVFNLWCVWLAAKNKVLNWPIGLVGIVLYMFLFYQIQLYSDLFEQVYFFIMTFVGWWLWTHPAKKNENKNKELKTGFASWRENIIWLVVTIIGSLILGYFMSKIHIFFPTYFPVAAALPYWDAFTTVMSFVATILMAKRKVECWYYWILVDIIGIILYFSKDVRFISLEYVIFLIIATKGLSDWLKECRGSIAKVAETKGFKLAIKQ